MLWDKMARSIAVGLCFKYRLQNVKMRKAPDVFSFQLKPPSSSRGTQIQTEIAGKSFWELRRDEDSLSLGRRRRHWQQQQQLKQRQRQQQHQPRLPTRVVGEKRGRCGSSSGSVAAVGPQKLWMRVRVWFWVWVWVRMWMLVPEWNQTKRRCRYALTTQSKLYAHSNSYSYSHSYSFSFSRIRNPTRTRGAGTCK